ncbi:MAG: TrmB family transcriptional regulator [Candidatus Marinimicrobia bacterium]|nr:TrmB family transcriptional regulator [Candidatus Neomarinimicrobiota bacterium]
MNINIAEKEIIDLLTEFGLAANLGKTYVALLNNNPATGYEICTQSGVPRSAIYSVLNKLESIGIINSIGKSPKRYIPIPPSGLLEHFSQLHSDRMSSLTDALENLDTKADTFDFWHIHGYRNLILKLREAVSNAKEKIFLSVWAKDLIQLENELENAEKRETAISIFTFTKLNRHFGNTISYNLDEEKLKKVWNPKIILVQDQQITIMGSTSAKNGNRAIWTDNKAITEIATNHILLDITLAAQRLKFDPNPIVKPMMKQPDLNLDDMLP